MASAGLRANLLFASTLPFSCQSCRTPGTPGGTMVNPGSSSQPPPVTAGSLSWKRCAGCGGKIADRFLLYAMDSYWHSRCLKCSCCQAQLGDIGTSCYTKSGMILCRNDYIRLFGNSGACSACGQSIPASELVMRAQGNVYHLKCFTCSTCRNRLVPGDRFHYINGSLFCEHDRPTALINGHLNSLQSNPLLPDQKVMQYLMKYKMRLSHQNEASEIKSHIKNINHIEFVSCLPY
ncbi:LIM domain transcription factor LMO4 [Chelonia mydas]|uniref:LIM domain transcription factor LMO4 n=1 Tax=Chelonia mydas TaxID=8469 RepID=M7B5H3_CHEMY|nr:LIM domain transcription factor LMO4 [Chelonia mydas]